MDSLKYGIFIGFETLHDLSDQFSSHLNFTQFLNRVKENPYNKDNFLIIKWNNHTKVIDQLYDMAIAADKHLKSTFIAKVNFLIDREVNKLRVNSGSELSPEQHIESALNKIMVVDENTNFGDIRLLESIFEGLVEKQKDKHLRKQLPTSRVKDYLDVKQYIPVHSLSESNQTKSKTAYKTKPIRKHSNKKTQYFFTDNTKKKIKQVRTDGVEITYPANSQNRAIIGAVRNNLVKLKV